MNSTFLFNDKIHDLVLRVKTLPSSTNSNASDLDSVLLTDRTTSILMLNFQK